MGFPAGAVNNQVTTVNGITYTYSTAKTAWLRTSSPIFYTYTASSIPPTAPKLGDQWYDTTSDTIFQYIFDGTNNFWVDWSSGFQYTNPIITGATLIISGLSSLTGDVTAAANLVIGNQLTVNNDIVTSGDLIPTANVTQNIGSPSIWWGTFYGISTQAKYADIAEKYLADKWHPPGTVVVFGGTKEITISTASHDTRVAGVISTDPAYLMNADTDGLSVALTGRVPCFVKGPVEKGTLLVTSDQPGVAQAINMNMYKPGSVIGKSLENIDTTAVEIIEVAVGRF